MKNKFTISIPTILVLLLTIYLFPWKKIDWGTFRLGPERTITVTGTAKSQELNQVARFNASVTVIDNNKDAAISQVEETISSLIEAVKDFGVQESDIKTESISIYQREVSFDAGNTNAEEPGEWRVSNAISIVLRETTKATELTALLSTKGATSVYGPNFGVEDTTHAEIMLLDKAISDAKGKALSIAQTMGAEISEMISVVEGNQNPGVFPTIDAYVGTKAIEPGTSTLNKTVTVTFRLKQ